MKQLSLFMLLFLFVTIAQLSVAETLTLTDSVREILDTNPAALEKLKEYNASIYERDQESSGFRPVIEFSAETGYQDVSNSNTNFDSEDDWISGAGVVLRQNIIDGGYTRNGVKAKSALAKVRLFNYCSEINTLAFQSVESYINLLKYDQLVQLAVDNVEIHKKILESIRTRVQAGTGGSASLSRVQGRLAAAQSKLFLRENDYKNAVYKYHQLIGRYVDVSELVLPDFNAELLPANLKDAFIRQIDNHPALIAADFNIKSQKLKYKQDKSAYYPTLDLEASENWRQDYNGISGDDVDGRIMLKLRYRFYDGGNRRSLAQKNISLINKQQQARNRVRRSLLNDLQLTWSGYKLLESQVGALRKNMFFTHEALKSYKAEFKLGKRNLINILDAENEYQNARSLLAASQYDLITAKYRILSSIGTITQNLNLTSPAIEELKKVKKMRPAAEDTLPLNVDFDGDDIVNRRDLSDNSLHRTQVNSLGADSKKAGEYLIDSPPLTAVKTINVAQKSDLDPAQFKTDVAIKLNIISFKYGSVELTDASKKIMRRIIELIRPLAMDGLIQIRVSTNDFDTDRNNYVLALQRGYNIMRIFSMHNMDATAMRVFTTQANIENSLSIKVITNLEGFKDGYQILDNTGIEFVPGTLDLENQSIHAVKDFAEKLRGLGYPPFDIIVFSNDTDKPVKNRKLSAERAEVIRSSLAAAGCTTDFAVPVAWGSYQEDLNLYTSSNKTNTHNRVEFVVRRK